MVVASENVVCLLSESGSEGCCENCRFKREMEGLQSYEEAIITPSSTERSPNMKKLLLVLNCLMLGLGISVGPLVMRLYYLHGGQSIWLSAWLETAGWPLMIIPLLVSFIRRRASDPTAKLIFIKPTMILSAAGVGIIAGLADCLYAFGVKRIPVSTSSLILATQLAFTAGFALLVVGQKFTAYSVNAVALLTFGAVVLAFHVSGDRPPGESQHMYFFGFFSTLASAALYAFMLPLIELIYKKSKETVTFPLVMEIQLVLSLSATILCTLGMLITGDYKSYAGEVREYKLGVGMYFGVLILSAVIWQLFYLGAAGVIHHGSSLLSGVIIALCLPVTEILAVVFYREKFQVEKGLSLALSLWGFLSYFCGEAKQSRKKKKKMAQAAIMERLGYLKV